MKSKDLSIKIYLDWIHRPLKNSQVAGNSALLVTFLGWRRDPNSEVGKVTSNQVIKRSQLELPGRFFVVRKSRRGDLPDVSSEKKNCKERRWGLVGFFKVWGEGTCYTRGFFNERYAPPKKKKSIPGDSSRDLFIPDRWRSPFQPLKGSRFHHPKKITFRRIARYFKKLQNH